MAKETPFFKFFTGEWANGSIVLEDYEVQGIFINICCWYWSMSGELTEKQIRKKFRNEEAINILLEEEIIKLGEDKIVINFLDEQLEETQYLRKKASEAGKASARKRQESLKNSSTEIQRPLNEPSTTVQPIREDKDKEEDKEKIREDKYKRENEFRHAAQSYQSDYSQELINAFCDYWTESKPNGKKMKFEMQKTFDIGRRLATWERNNFGSKPKEDNGSIFEPKFW